MTTAPELNFEGPGENLTGLPVLIAPCAMPDGLLNIVLPEGTDWAWTPPDIGLDDVGAWTDWPLTDVGTLEEPG